MRRATMKRGKIHTLQQREKKCTSIFRKLLKKFSFAMSPTIKLNVK